MSEHRTSDRPVSGWAVGGVLFAGTLMIVAGTFQALQGLAAIIDDDFFVVANGYAYDIDVTAWGWIHLIVGIIVALTGAFLFSGSGVAAGVAMFIAVLAAISNFFFVPYYPLWSLLNIGLAVWVIWSLTRPGVLRND